MRAKNCKDPKLHLLISKLLLWHDLPKTFPLKLDYHGVINQKSSPKAYNFLNLKNNYQTLCIGQDLIREVQLVKYSYLTFLSFKFN